MLKIITPVVVLVAAVLLGKYLIETGPEPRKKPSEERVPVVEVIPLEPRSYTVQLNASGIVKAGVQSHLVSEVTGKVIHVADVFQEGGYFLKDQVLLQIDRANYENALAVAASDVAANEASLIQLQEEQKSNRESLRLAKKNLAIGKKEVARVTALWKKKLAARSLVDSEEQKVNQLEQKLQDLRGVQSTFASRRNAIQAKINAAKARLRQEDLNLSRTTIRAPYSGRVLKKNVDIGQYVSTGTSLGEIYATDFVNVDIPLSIRQYELLDMPEPFRGETIPADDWPSVELSAPKGNNSARWTGRVVRSSAALDAKSRLITVIARIDKPFEESDTVSVPIRIGQYLNATIRGKIFDSVYVLPSAAVLYNREIRLLKNGRIKIMPVDVIWNNGEETVVKTEQDLADQQLITTVLEQAIEGMKAITVEEKRKQAIADQSSKKNGKKAETDAKTGQKINSSETVPAGQPIARPPGEQHSGVLPIRSDIIHDKNRNPLLDSMNA